MKVFKFNGISGFKSPESKLLIKAFEGLEKVKNVSNVKGSEGALERQIMAKIG
ncbi:MAG: hypothetical protein IH934_00390 [Nanoarchaeota archaeon]|nr:hypothetical protein [Nanoarchaeota archaeon]